MPVRVVVACCILKMMVTAPPVWPQRHPLKTTGGSTASPSIPKSGKAADFAGEPYIIERYDTTVRLESDGTSQRDLLVRVRVQTEDGVQRFREMSFAFDSAIEKVDVRSVSITKPGRSAVNAVTDEANKEVPAAITRDAPAYTSYREKHVLLHSLQPGDVLDYRIETHTAALGGPGECWFQYSFIRNAVVLEEHVEMNLPASLRFRTKSPGFSQTSGTETRSAQSGEPAARDFSFARTSTGGRTILVWKHANLTRQSDGEQQNAHESRTKPPDIQLTSFAGWNEVVLRYVNLARSSDASADVREKTQELVKGATTDVDKARALYEYVSKDIRSVVPPADFAALQPLPPANVLANGYGDSLDKHLLLATMLKAAGIPSNTVLIPSGRKLDPELPSPGQFDRVLTLALAAGTPVWLDPADEVAPYGFLPAALRAKSALLVSPSGPAKIIETPVDPPFRSTQQVDLDCALSDIGKLTGTARYSLRGDTEFVLRTAFRRARREQWDQIAQTILALDGLQGEVTSVAASDPLDTEKPFELTVQFFRTNALDWPNTKARIALPLLTIAMPDPPTKTTEPVKLGSPLDVATRLTLSFPPGVTAQTPIGTAVSRDYAEFKSSYRLEKGTLIAQRSLNFKLREVPASRTADYLAFTHAVEADEGQPLLVDNPSASVTAIPTTAAADDLFEAGEAALQSGNTTVAIPLLKRATALEPNHKQAWNDLGLAQLHSGNPDDAVAAFRKELEVNPLDEHANDYLGLALQEQGRNDEAADAFRKQIERNPLDTVAHSALGRILLAQRDYIGAVPELEKAAILTPDNAILEVSLGRAYLNAGDKAKALASFQKAVALSPTPPVWNDVAFSLAEQGAELDKAEQYAESAIAATTANLQKVTAGHLTAQSFARVEDLGDYWDTLGWVYFRKGDLNKARLYVNAAWLLNQRGEVGDHLAQICDKSGDKECAIHTYALALAAQQPSPETRARLTLLLGGNGQIDDLVAKARSRLAESQRFEVKGLPKADTRADFLVLLSARPDEKGGISAHVDSVEFLGGSESLKPLAVRLNSLNYGAIFPDNSPAKLVRRGTLACSAATGDCSFALGLPGNLTP